MESPRHAEAPRIVWWEWAGVLAAAALFVALRLPLYTYPGVLLGWHSDAALLGLMARAIVAGDYPILFWGSDYLAPLTSVFAAAVGMLIGEVGPLALRLGTAIEVFAALVFFQFALRRAVGRRAALLTTFWLVAGPAFLFKLTYAPLSAEQYFFLGAVTFWYVMRSSFARLHHWLVLGLLAGAGWWIHRAVMFVIVPALVVIALYDRRALRERRDQLAAVLALACGAALGYLPVVFGRLAIDQRLYAPVKLSWNIGYVQQRLVETVRYDVWELIGADKTPLGWIVGVTLAGLLVAAALHFRPRRETMLAAGVVAVSFAFSILSTEAYRGAVRYVMIALPIVYAFAAAEIVRLRDAKSGWARAAGMALAVAVAAALFVPRHAQAADVAAARLEQHEHWPGGFDPRPALRRIAEGRYTVCYANVWVAHKLEWLSDTGVRFIPYRSVNRRMVESLRLAARPGPKCFVDLQGNVRPLTAREQADLRIETLWQAQGWWPSASPLR